MQKADTAVTIIGGADGPTAVFLAGRMPSGFYLTAAFVGGIAVGVLLTALIIWYRRRK